NGSNVESGTRIERLDDDGAAEILKISWALDQHPRRVREIGAAPLGYLGTRIDDADPGRRVLVDIAGARHQELFLDVNERDRRFDVVPIGHQWEAGIIGGYRPSDLRNSHGKRGHVASIR